MGLFRKFLDGVIDRWAFKAIESRISKDRSLQEEVDSYRLSLLVNYFLSKNDPSGSTLLSQTEPSAESSGFAESLSDKEIQGCLVGQTLKYLQAVQEDIVAAQSSSSSSSSSTSPGPVPFSLGPHVIFRSNGNKFPSRKISSLNIASVPGTSMGSGIGPISVASHLLHNMDSPTPPRSTAFESAANDDNVDSIHRTLARFVQFCSPPSQCEDVNGISKDAEMNPHSANDIEFGKLHAVRGFSTFVQPSSIHNAGNGVFVRGTCEPGQIVALYPGCAFILPIHAKLLPPMNTYLQQNLYLISRYDKITLDGDLESNLYRKWDNFNRENAVDSHDDQSPLPRSVLKSASRDPDEAVTLNDSEWKRWQRALGSIPYHGLAVGHIVNHPPPGVDSNVMIAPLNIPWNFPEHLLPLIPNRWADIPPLYYQTSSPMKCIALVATKFIEDKEEVFLNYRLNPALPLPSWYQQVDGNEDQRRWSKK